MDFKDIMEILEKVPTNTEMGVYLYALNDWFAARTLVVTPALAAIGWIVYKTPWSWDNKLYRFILNKLGIGANRDGEQVTSSERSGVQRDDQA